MARLRSIWQQVILVVAIISVPIFAVWIGYELVLAATATTDAQILFHKEIILAIITGASLLYLVFTLAKNWEMASATRDAAEASQQTLQQMRDVRDEETAPYVLVYFDVPYGDRLIYLIIKNIGKTPAKNIKMTFNPPLQNSDKLPLKFSAVKNGIPSLAPDQEIRSLFDAYLGYTQQNLPETYEVALTYNGGMSNKERTDTQTLDLSMYHGGMFADEKDIEDLVSETKHIVSSLNNIAAQIRETKKQNQHDNTIIDVSPEVVMPESRDEIEG